MIIYTKYGYEFYIDSTNTIKVSDECQGQGIITFLKDDIDRDYYSLYKWFNEGGFPSEFELQPDTDSYSRYRVKIIGVDEI